MRLVLLCVLVTARVFAQGLEGELRLQIADPSGQPVPARIEVTLRSPEFGTTIEAAADGDVRIPRLPLGIAEVEVSYPGFRTHSRGVEIRSAVPVVIKVTLEVEPVRSAITVERTAPVLDPRQPALIMHGSQRMLSETAGATMGRGLIDVITTMPGWLLEANAVLHPRGSEYDTQYVIDGMPVYDNRSLAFAPAFLASEFDSVSIMTSGIPAEYGRRLGGVIVLDTRRPEPGTEISLQGGSYGTALGSLSHHRVFDKTALSVAVHGGATNRYLDPPSLQNFTNEATSTGFHTRLDQDLGTSDRLTFYLRSNRTGFMVPNDPEQEESGQRQDRRLGETAGQVHWQRTISPRALASVKGMFRDLDSHLWSNPLSTPVRFFSDRGFREHNIIGSISINDERHSVRIGGDFRRSNIREGFRFERGSLQERANSTEASAFVQDHIRVGNFAAALGVRFDSYRLLVHDSAVSPRGAVSYYIPAVSLMLRGTYDRIFQPPPAENLLVSSAAARLTLPDVQDVIPVPASRGHFYEVGVRKSFRDTLRLDVSHYWRTFENYADDDVFLNTGLSFPITFDTARVQGTEVRVEMPLWRGFSSYISWSNMKGTATAPVTGGLFLEGGEAEELRDSTQRFPITQDQRNTVAAQVRFAPTRRIWTSAGLRYGSGLPFEADDDDDDDDEGEDDDDDDDDDGHLPAEILRRVNFARGRLRPSMSLDFSVGARLWDQGSRSVWLQMDARNVTDRLNIVNFSGVFSGTAIAPGRQISIQLRARF